jgi:hypothetical protein
MCLFGTICMWLMWISAYMHQMYPLIEPLMEQKLRINV